MYTNQVQNLTAALSQIAEPQQVQAIVQSLANCAQPLTTRGPLTVDGAASSSPPRGGVFTSPPNYGGASRGGQTGNTLQDWSNGNYPQGWPRLGGDVWNQQFFNQLGGNGFYAGDNNYWGGDTQYGGNYLTNNNVYNNQSFLNNILQNYDYSENYFNQVNNNTLNNNFNDWYTQQFVDNSYTDFSTSNNFTTNQYNQTVNNFAGDNYFDNTYTSNNTYNNNVTNLGNVINEGDVYNNANTYLTENKTFVTNNNTTEEISEYVTNIITNGVAGRPVRLTYLRGVAAPQALGVAQVPTDAISGGSISLQADVTFDTISVPTTATLNEGTCAIELGGYEDHIVVTNVSLKAGGQKFTLDPENSKNAVPALAGVKINGLVSETTTVLGPP